MDPAVEDLITQCFYLTLILSLPPIVVASIVGIIFSLFQAITQLQEQTLSFGIKLIAVCITIFLTASWFSQEILRYSQNIFENFHMLQY